MSNNKSSRDRMKARGWNVLIVLILLGVYLTGTLEVSSLHRLFHDPTEEQVLHSKINEQNSCHQLLYHNSNGKRCEHTAHITSFKKCLICHLSVQSSHFFESKSMVSFNFGADVLIAFSQSVLLLKPSSFLTPRAPPVT